MSSDCKDRDQSHPPQTTGELYSMKISHRELDKLTQYWPKGDELQHRLAYIMEENEKLQEKIAELEALSRLLRCENEWLADGTEKDVEEIFENLGNERIVG
jgi:hypothetical protein